ncbi:MAG TPA: hypothetical protein VFA46_09365 [Actinomycetes bacterium]|nr:hypothetical protein [Actinomycetes bacterium]
MSGASLIVARTLVTSMTSQCTRAGGSVAITTGIDDLLPPSTT